LYYSSTQMFYHWEVRQHRRSPWSSSASTAN
jgi:hypothetical protein